MWVVEQILFYLARALYRTEMAHSSEMKSALQHIDAYDSYRTNEINRILEAVENYRIPITAQNIVDFDCNDGAISVEYLRRGAATVVGVDIDGAAIQRAREMYHDERLSFVQSTATTIPIESSSVDVVVSYDAFEHVSEPSAVLKELYRILAPCGRVLIGTTGWYHPFVPHLWSVMPVPWAHVFLSERTILKVCRRVYHSKWYIPNMHDYDEKGIRFPDKYTHHSISTAYLNKYLIKDFEQTFLSTGFSYETYCVPFGSWYANWTSAFLQLPWIREFISGYVWFKLTKLPNKAFN